MQTAACCKCERKHKEKETSKTIENDALVIRKSKRLKSTFSFLSKASTLYCRDFVSSSVAIASVRSVVATSDTVRLDLATLRHEWRKRPRNCDLTFARREQGRARSSVSASWLVFHDHSSLASSSRPTFLVIYSTNAALIPTFRIRIQRYTLWLSVECSNTLG